MATGSELSVESNDIPPSEQITGLALGTRRRAFKQPPVPAVAHAKLFGVRDPGYRLNVAEASSRSLRLPGEPVYLPDNSKYVTRTKRQFKVAGNSAYVHVYPGGLPGLGKRS